MKPRKTPLVAAILWLVSVWAGVAVPISKPLMAYYMPWYSAKPYSTNWGWHWTMDHFNPDTINAVGERQIASWYYPLIGPYDSSDPAVLEYHVLLMKLAGIDGVIVDWYGSADYMDYGRNNRLPVGAGAFSWSPMWMSQVPGTRGVLSGTALKTYLADFDQKAAAWPAYISSAFPRFHDIYHQAGVGSSLGYIGDRHAGTFRETLSRALTNSAAMVQLVTWNDYGEGSILEPTREYGCRDLGMIQDFRRQYLQPEFPAGTNDLAMAGRFYNLRRQSATNSGISPVLDDIFTNIVAGRLEAANRQLQALEK